MARANKVCENCFYSRKAMNEDLVVCAYMDDILRKDEIMGDKQDWKTARYFASLSNFSGDVFEAFAEPVKDGEPVMKVCVLKTAKCGKWAAKSH